MSEFGKEATDLRALDARGMRAKEKSKLPLSSSGDCMANSITNQMLNFTGRAGLSEEGGKFCLMYLWDTLKQKYLVMLEIKTKVPGRDLSQTSDLGVAGIQIVIKTRGTDEITQGEWKQRKGQRSKD